MMRGTQHSDAYYRDRMAAGVRYEDEIRAIERDFGVSFAEMRDPTRRPSIVRARWEVMAMLRVRGWSLTKIGAKLCRDHTTVMYALNARAADMIEAVQAAERAEAV